GPLTGTHRVIVPNRAALADRAALLHRVTQATAQDAAIGGVGNIDELVGDRQAADPMERDLRTCKWAGQVLGIISASWPQTLLLRVEEVAVGSAVILIAVGAEVRDDIAVGVENTNAEAAVIGSERPAEVVDVEIAAGTVAMLAAGRDSHVTDVSET